MIFWFVLAATVAVSYSAHKKAKQAMRDAEDAAKGLLINKNSNIDFIPVIYGTRRVGGTRVFISTKDVSGGDENEYLYIALVVSEGEVESISDLKFDDIDAGDGRFSGLVDYNVHLGTNNQAADSLLQEAPDWTSSHQLKGVAYIALRLKYDQDAWNGIPNITALVQGRKLYDPRTQQTVFSNNPALCLYDYLTNTRYGKGLLPPVIDQTSIATAANECDQFEVTPYSGGSDIKIFQCNYVLKPEEKIIDNVRDILASCRGFLPFSNGKYSLKIDSASSSVKTFNTDNIIGGINIKGGDKSTTQNRNMVRFANADIDYQPDQAAYPDAGSTEDVTYLEENNDERLQETVELKSCTDYYIARDFARIITERSRNHLRVTFQTDSSGLELNIADVITVNHPTPDWGDKLFQVEEITLNPDMTANILAIEYDSSIYAYDESAVQKTYPDTNLPNPFSVSPPTNLTSTNSTAVSSDGSVIPSLTFNWTAPADSFVQKYEFQYKRESSILDHGFITDSHTENPDYGLITSSAGVTVDYGNVTDASTTGETVYTSVIVNSTQFVITGTVPDVNYNVRVRSINDLGVRSSFVDLSALVAGDTTPPSIPNSVAAAGGLKEITITWERPVEHDYSHVEVWEGIIASTLAASKIAIASGDNYTRTGLDYDSTRYYHLKSVDFSGNVSDFSSTVSATTLFVDSDAFSDSVTNLFAEAGAYGIEPVGTLPASGDFIGQIKFNSSTVALYRWTGTEWTDDIFTIEEASVNAASFANEIEPVSIVNSLPSPSGYTGPTMIFLTTDSQLYRYDSSVPEFTRAIQTIDLVGEVAEVNFSEDLMPPKVVSTLPTAAEDLWQGRQVFLTTDNKLYRYNGTEWTASVSTTDLSGQVSGPQIQDEAISNAKIAVDAIQGDVIAAAAIDGTKIADNAISAVKIADLAVATSKLALEAVTEDIIAASAITETKISDSAITTNKINASAITAGKIAADAVTANKIEANAVTADKINASAVTADKINAGAVTTAKISAGAVTAGAIAANTITSSQIASDAITANEIAAGAVNAEQINAGAITGDKIDANTITASKMVLAGSGSCLNDDPLFKDSASWNGGATFIDDLTLSGDLEPGEGAVGNNGIRNATGQQSVVTSVDLIPVDFNKTYRVRCMCAESPNNTGRLYVGVDLRDENGAKISGDGSYWSYDAASSVKNTDHTWIEYSAQFGAGTANDFPSNAKTMRPLLLLSHLSASDTASGITREGHWYAQDLRIEEAMPAELIVDGAIQANKIASNAVTANKIEAGAVVAGKIAADAVTANEIAANAVTADSIAANAITSGKIAANTITAADIAANAITTSELAANSVTAGSLAAGAITATAIASNIITSDHIASNTIQTGNIAANQITGGLIAASGVITSAAQINNLVVSGAKIANGAISSAKIGNAAITTAKIGNLQVDTLQIANNAVSVNTFTEGTGFTESMSTGFTLGSIFTGGAVQMRPWRKNNTTFSKDILSSTINFVSGQPVSLRGKFRGAYYYRTIYGYSWEVQPFYWRIDILRNNAVIKTFYPSVFKRHINSIGNMGTESFEFVDTSPIQGNNTYKIRVGMTEHYEFLYPDETQPSSMVLADPELIISGLKR